MITPIEIRQQTFKRALRGYDKEDVQAFLMALSSEWETLLEAHRTLKEQLDKLQGSYDTLKEVEGMLHKTLMQAEQSAASVMENARQKADLKIREAENHAREVLRKSTDERQRIEGDISQLSRQREDVIVQLEIFLKSQMDRLNGFERQNLQPRRLTAYDSERKESAADNLFGALETGRNNGNGSASKSILEDIADEL
jgi:cell division initiation protein